MDDQFLPPRPPGQAGGQNPTATPGPDTGLSFGTYQNPNVPPSIPAPVSPESESSQAVVFESQLQPQPIQPQPTAIEQPVFEQSQQPAPSLMVPKARERRFSKKRALILLVVVLVVALAGAGTFIFIKKHAKKAPVAVKPIRNDVQLIRYGALEGMMNQYAPTLANDPGTVYLNKQIFEPLVGYENGTKVVPILVDGWTNPDSSTWVFNLKANVKFHDGNILSAKDVLYSYQQYKNNPAFASLLTSTIKTVEAPANDQVKITTNGPDPLLLNKLADLLIVDSTAAGKVDPVYGTGPYELKPGTTPDADHIDLVAFDGFHGSHIYTQEVQFMVYRVSASQAVSGQAAAFNDIKGGKLDLVGPLSGTTLSDALSTTLTKLPVGYPPTYYVIPNTLKKGSPLASQKLRQAIYQTLDTNAITAAQNVAGVAQSQLVVSYIPGYNSSLTRPAKDTDAASRLVREAGYPNGTSFILTIPSQFNAAGTEIVNELKVIGITVKLDVQADANKVASDGAAGKYDAYLGVDSSNYNDAADVYARQLQSKNYANPAVDSQLAQAGATLNQTDRLNSLQQAIKTAMDDTAVIPLYNSQQTWFTTNSALVMSQDLLKTDYGIYFYKVYSSK